MYTVACDKVLVHDQLHYLVRVGCGGSLHADNIVFTLVQKSLCSIVSSPKNKKYSHYLLTLMPMGGQVKFIIPQNTAGVSQIKGVAVIS